MNGFRIDRCIAETECTIVRAAMEIIEDEILNWNRQIQGTLSAGQFVTVQQRMTDEGSIYNGGRAFGRRNVHDCQSKL